MSKLKILVAEDDISVQLLYEKNLPENKFDLKIVGDGYDLLEMYKSWKPDIILLDILMPLMSGYAALKKIRKLEYETDSETVIIMATSMTDKEDIVDCIKVGIQGYIVKPFKASRITEMVMAYYNQASKGS